MVRKGIKWLRDRLADGDVPTVSTGEVDTTQLQWTREDYPATPRQPENEGGLPTVRPHPYADNPIVDGSSDPDIDGFADPFIVWDSSNNQYVIFGEAFMSAGGFDIGYVTNEKGTNGGWDYQGEAISTATDYSYPLPLHIDGFGWRLLPGRIGTVSTQPAFSADSFPNSWTQEADIVDVSQFGYSNIKDFTPWRWNNRWFATFANNNNDGVLLYADEGKDILGRSWSEHPDSPVSGLTRMRGRAIPNESTVTLMGKPDVSVLRLANLSTSSGVTVGTGPQIVDSHNGVAQTWHRDKMHHVDMVTPKPPFSEGMVVVDGNDGSNWSVGLYRLSERRPGIAKKSLSSNVSISSGTSLTTLDLDKALYSTAGVTASPGINGVDIEQSGYYRVSGQVTYTTNNITAQAEIQSGNRGELVTGGGIGENTVQTSTVATVTPTVEYLKSGDEVFLATGQVSGSSQDVWDKDRVTFLSVQRVW